MNTEILFVDDEPAVLEGYKRLLSRHFHVHTALGGEAALAEIKKKGSYAVVVSDMRMPGMSGVQLLAQVRHLAPQTVRVVLTGHADIESAMDALNENEVFRFLTKPCSDTVLKKTLTACLLQYQLITAEKELLEATLMGSIKVLTDVLSLASPAAFGRSVRINRYVQHMVRELQLEMPWRYEAAAMLSQVGCITLDPELLESAYCGEKLAPEEQALFDMHPSVARDLLRNVPRLEGIAWIVGQQLGPVCPDKNVSASIRTGAIILRLAIAFDQLKIQGFTDSQAIAKLETNPSFDPRVVQTLKTLSCTDDLQSQVISVSQLEPGMIVSEDIRSKVGLLVVGKGQEVTYPLVVRLRNFHRRGAVNDEVSVLVRKSTSRN